ncbi:hypothetical protein SCLCIDRAFT_762181 [Scleroderma citrinum Foug A]|uniref:Uncharacterized protein n=1 Tax=Scleroderma citrinum Foug A TaxID=1036808 RepID=A0A0C3AE75_9AGAM|nr:hypothetical protein SCLCIDRAFT_762181 [Scleroderma citrinum Foug A]
MTAAVGFDSFFARNVIQRSRPSGWRHGVLLVRFLIHAGIHGCAFQKACFDDKDEWYGAGRDETVRCSADFWRSGLSRLLPGHLWRRGNTCTTRCVGLLGHAHVTDARCPLDRPWIQVDDGRDGWLGKV